MKMTKYSAEIDDYLRQIVPGTPFKEVTTKVNEKFGRDLTVKQIKAHCNNLKLRNGCRHGLPSGYSILFTKAEQDFIAEHYKGILTADLTDMLNKEFGTDYKPSQVRSYKKNRHMSSGVDGTFRAEGRRYKLPKGTRIPGSEKGWFKKGQMPHNHLEVGAQVFTFDGYIKVKIAEPNYWEFLHKLVWQEANGPIPPEHNIIFLDGNKQNCNLENLYCIPKDEYGALQSLRSENPEITLTAVAVVKLKYLALEKDGKREHKYKRKRNNTAGSDGAD